MPPSVTWMKKWLGPLLRKRGVITGDDEIAYVLAYYDIKKTDFEIVRLTCQKMESAVFELEFSLSVFPKPTLYFHAKKVCHCGLQRPSENE